MTNNPITDKGIERLRHLRRLKTVWLSQTYVTNAGIAELHKALPNCKVIK